MILALTLAFTSMARPSAAPIDLGPQRCAMYLDSAAAYDLDVRARATRLVRWISFRDPAFGRALAAADSIATQHDLLNLPLGFTIAPAGGDWFEYSELSDALKKIARVIPESHGIGGGFGADRKAFKKMRRTRDWISHSYRRSDDQARKIEIVSRILTNTHQVLSWLTSADVKVDTTNTEYPRLSGELILTTTEDFSLQVRVEWAKSFLARDLDGLSHLRADFEDQRVVTIVVELLFDHLQTIVELQQNLGFEISRVSTKAQVAHTWRGFGDFDFLSPEDAPGRPLPEFPSATTPLAGLTAPIPKSAPPAIIFRDASILKFVESPLILDAPTIERDVHGAWLKFQAAADLVNDTLVQLRDLPVMSDDWMEWAERTRVQSSSVVELNAHLNQNARGANAALPRLAAAEDALAKLLAWVVSARGAIKTLDENSLSRLSPRAVDALHSTAEYSSSVAMLIEHSLEALRSRHEATVRAIKTLASLKLLAGDVMRGEHLEPKDSAGTILARETMITALERLGRK